MKKMSRHTFSGLMLAVSALCGAFTSCSVKEDRTPCPCYLEVFFADREHIKDPVSLLGCSGDGSVLFSESINSADYPDFYVKAVRKGELRFGTCERLTGEELIGSALMIPEGSQCDSVYTFCESVDCTGEIAKVEAVYHKQFATVYVGFTQGGADQVRLYDYLVTGNGCGTQLLSYEGVEGPFRFRPSEVSGNAITFRLPRQMDDSLSLTISDGDGSPIVIPLGAYVANLGYNWAAQDLQDIYITFDIVGGKVSIGVADWETAGDFEIRKVEF